MQDVLKGDQKPKDEISANFSLLLINLVSEIG